MRGATDQDVKPFTPEEHTVIEGAACTWCGVGVGQDCAPRDRAPHARAHAQRWYDYWNATQDAKIPVYQSHEAGRGGMRR